MQVGITGIQEIIFLTNKDYGWNLEGVTQTNDVSSLIQAFRANEVMGGDTENTQLNPIYARPLLSQFSDGKKSWVIDKTSIDCSFLKEFEDKTILTANGQYDYMIWKYHYGVEFRKLKDVMIIDQILGRGSGRLNNLEAIHLRRLGFYMPVPKSTRGSFTKMGKNPQFESDHILYGAYDPYCLFAIYEKQKPLIEEYKLEKRIYDIAFPLIPILGDMCLEGFTLNEEKWLQNLRENKENKYRIECKLDEIIREFAKTHDKLKGGIWTRKRFKTDGEQVGLFGDSITVENESKGNVSYTSTKQMIKLFTILKEPIPQQENKNKENKKSWEESKMKDSFAEGALEQYKIENPSSRMIPFINYLLELHEIEKEINSFGEIFIKERVKDGKSNKKFKRGYKNSITGKVHTIYKQEFTANGRLSSGDGQKKKKGTFGVGFYNSQQIPKKNKYRNCFTLTQEEINEGIKIGTDDLSQAELVILASNSKDPILIDIISNGKDLHNYLSTIYYTKIITYILDNMNENRAYDEIFHLLKPNRLTESLLKKVEVNGVEKNIPYTKDELKQIHENRVIQAIKDRGIIVDKKKFPDIRDPAKNVHYGITYGAGESKIAQTLNIAPHYAKLALQGMNEAIPVAFEYLNRIARFGVKNGYTIFNTRTNSRHWFKSWLEAKERGRELTGAERSAIERFCKNSAMSGTQADMIKEAMVNIDKWVRENNIWFRWLLQVHDKLKNFVNFPQNLLSCRV